MYEATFNAAPGPVARVMCSTVRDVARAAQDYIERHGVCALNWRDAEVYEENGAPVALIGYGGVVRDLEERRERRQVTPDHRGIDGPSRAAGDNSIARVRGMITASAEEIALPARFEAVADVQLPMMHIYDLLTGRKATVGLFAYRAVRETLQALFED